MDLRLTSEAFASGKTIPTQYTCEGADVSPPLTWDGAPDDVQSFVLICDDPDAPNGVWSHWVLYNIPPGKEGLAEDVPREAELPWGGVHGRNDFGDLGYGGPCPPPGPAHHYYFRLYALDMKIDLPAGATRQQVIDWARGHIITETELMGRFARS